MTERAAPVADTIPLARSAVPAIMAALQAYQRSICAAIQTEPFKLSRYGERNANWAAIMAIRDALGDDFSPRKG